METFEAVRTLLAVRSYRSAPVPAEAVRRILEAGRLTGSSRNRQPWRFVTVQDPATLRRLGELASRGPYIASAPLCIAVVVDDGPGAQVDGGRCVQSMMLTAWELGLGSNWVTPTDAERPALHALLGVPDELRLLTLVPFGYPDRRLGRGRKNRKPLAEIAFAERFGAPLPGG